MLQMVPPDVLVSFHPSAACGSSGTRRTLQCVLPDRLHHTCLHPITSVQTSDGLGWAETGRVLIMTLPPFW
ncbi:MAG TPA: hypothetical protein VFN35_16675 [Ktedonobacteraceae bacterium]|nr:hypothetical protein [Ktedonobacteraceae bacterium]